MSKQKEDVLLMVKHVKYKKVDGTLYVNSGRVAWRNQTSDSFRISAPFEDIRMQRVSPDQKEKVQLQLLMHNNESFTFQFSDPVGREKQQEMRNRVKEMLQNLLPKFKDKAHSELNEKFRLLEANPQLLALYKELVVTGILSSEEFWARPEDRIQIKQDDVFGECAAQDERILQSELRKSRRMRLSTHLNVGELEDKNAFEGYGTDLTDTNVTPVASAPVTPNASDQKLSANQLLLRRFNMHSIMILRSLSSIDPPGQHPVNHLDPTHNEASYKELASSGHLKERIFPMELRDEAPEATISLHLENTKDYFEGPTVAQSKP
ncbi:unnamed protein product, partial [Dibothriocephalus latus]